MASWPKQRIYKALLTLRIKKTVTRGYFLRLNCAAKSFVVIQLINCTTIILNTLVREQCNLKWYSKYCTSSSSLEKPKPILECPVGANDLSYPGSYPFLSGSHLATSGCQASSFGSVLTPGGQGTSLLPLYPSDY